MCCVLLCCIGRMRESSSGQELKIKEVDTRIEREIAELKTSIQASKVRPSPPPPLFSRPVPEKYVFKTHD